MQRLIILLFLCIAGVSCRDLTSAKFPAGTKNPEEYKTRDGALALYRGAVLTFEDAILRYVEHKGAEARLTDEYTNLSGSDSADLRRLSTTWEAGSPYSLLHLLRGKTQQALGALVHYAPEVSPALRGHLFALQAYAEILLADLYCSGIPLSTLDFEEDFTYQPGSPTDEVYKHALTLLDSALALSGDSLWVEYLARTGKARALLQLSEYREAAEVVQSVPTNYQYAVYGNVFGPNANTNIIRSNGSSVSNFEGGTGLPYHSDPRVDAVFITTITGGATGLPIYLPNKYLPLGSIRPVIVASGVEAQLIQAEADLHAGRIDAWLDRLNALRTDGTFQVEGTDTVWGIGSGASLYAEVPHVAAAQRGLPPLTDPAEGGIPPGLDAFGVRVNLLFAERAYWLFQTGQRQGDLRRLVREYGRRQDEVYPSGLHVLGIPYGTDVTLPITMEMEGANPYFTGCIHRDA